MKKYSVRPKEMRTYDESLKIYWDNYSVIETAKHEGREQGRQEGRDEGIEIGASQKALQIAQELKKMEYLLI